MAQSDQLANQLLQSICYPITLLIARIALKIIYVISSTTDCHLNYLPCLGHLP